MCRQCLFVELVLFRIYDNIKTMQSQGLKKLKMPDKPGVYFFLASPKSGMKAGKDPLFFILAKLHRLRVECGVISVRI
jgi:hypothetical protein